jgi:hypothetical protein
MGSDNSTDAGVERKVRFELFTTEDFSGNKGNIQFTLHISSDRKTLFDSVLAPIRIEEIPDSAHRIIFEKTVSAPLGTILKTGFYYSIENVGYSWHLEPFPANESFKVVIFSFK